MKDERLEQGDRLILGMIITAAHGCALMDKFDEIIEELKRMGDAKKARAITEQFYDAFRDLSRLHTFMKTIYSKEAMERSAKYVNILADVLKLESWDQRKMEEGAQQCFNGALRDSREDLKNKEL